MLNRFKRWKSIWYPDRYHGWGRKKRFFEGWYYKIVSDDEQLRLALIPGISMDEKGQQHCFIQMIDGTEGTTTYDRFEADQFVPSSESFDVSIEENYFNLKSIKCKLPHLTVDLQIHNPIPWPGNPLAPGVMGWYSFVPMMQCYHGVVSLHHRLSGTVVYKEKTHFLQYGIGYIEKDWGTSFPRCWIWMQSNHFDLLDRKISLMVSVAHIPWMGHFFVGYLVAFYLDGTLYQFSTYNGAKMKSSMDEDHVYLNFVNKGLTLSIKATKGHTGTLVSPIVGAMAGKVSESLSAKLEVELSMKGKLLYKGTGRNAGLEVAGDTTVLIND